MYLFQSVPIYVSDKPDKKYYAVLPGTRRRIYFGQLPYEHYHDKLGHYKHLDHHDKSRRRNFKARHERNRHKKTYAGMVLGQNIVVNSALE